MAIVDRHPPGAFAWIELATTDQAAAKTFYAKLLGWTVTEFPMGPGDIYSIFLCEGRHAGAAYTMRKEQREQGVPPNWMVYIESAGVDASARRAAELGGTVLAPPMDVMDAGRMAVVRDPTGAIFSLWQSRRNTGIGVSGKNTFCWADLSTPDPAAAKQFYSQLFGWTLSQDPRDPSGYLHIKNGERYIGGIPPAAARNPMAPPHWMVWFDVADCDAAVRTANQDGGRTLLAPNTMAKVGRIAVVTDPQGAAFGLITPAMA